MTKPGQPCQPNSSGGWQLNKRNFATVWMLAVLVELLQVGDWEQYADLVFIVAGSVGAALSGDWAALLARGIPGVISSSALD